MKHYDIERWVDFARNLVRVEERTEMNGHLSAGCIRCRSLAGLSEKLTAVCANLPASQVPDHAVRLARAIFPVQPQSRPTRGNRLPIEVIFDSFLAPAPAGLRSTWQVGWQGLYRAGACSLDLRIEPELKSSRASVTGQVNNHVAPSVPMGNLPVDLRCGNQIIARTVSNPFGEFQLEYEQRARLKLVVHLPDSRRMELPLKKLSFDEPAAKSRSVSRKR
ncbi:MAG: hypothetical protein KGN36_20760 [Acidobacteriota bacterium]|nr:hypothetical protein [Acidobacteriota bacterium]